MPKKISRDIIIPARKVQLIESLQHRATQHEELRQGGTSRKSFRWVGWLMLLIVVVAGTFYGTGLFSYATVRVVPRGAVLAVNDMFVASKEITPSTLPLKTMTLHAQESVAVPATEKKQVSEKASGEVVVYNTDPKPQPLIARTRFETPEGKVYRSVVDVIVPSASMVQGKKVPGSLTTTVVASLPGADFNAGLKDFTLPALKGTPRFTSVYARSKTPLAGGFLGERMVAGAADMQAAQLKLDAKLEQQLRAEAKAQLPLGYLVYPEGVWIRITDSSKELPQEGTSVQLRRDGTLEALLFKTSDLATLLAQKKIAGYHGEAITPSGLENLILTIENKPKDGLHLVDKLSCTLTGEVSLVYTFDVDAFRASLAGISKKEYIQVLAKYPAIDSAQIALSPKWMPSFPSKPERIQVEILPLPR